MLEIITGEASKRYKKEKSETERSKTIDRYAQMKRFHYYRWVQVYMYDFMYTDTETMEEE